LVTPMDVDELTFGEGRSRWDDVADLERRERSV
jgi:hypothetical protein